MEKTIKDERSIKLYGNKPVVVQKSRIDEIVEYYSLCYNESTDWFNQNYKDDFLKYFANFMSYPGEIIKPWTDANDYFLPVTNINIETYVSRTMETLRGGQNFLTIYPRGKNDEKGAKINELLLRWQFEQQMKGYSKLVDSYRNKYIYGTSISHMPWNYEVCQEKVEGTFIFDTAKKDWIVDPDTKQPKDYGELEIESLLNSNPSWVVRDLYQDFIINDNPELEALDIFTVKVDPSGGNDIQKHAYSIIETTESLNSIRQKVKKGEYDKSQFKKFEEQLNSNSVNPEEVKTSTNPNEYNDGLRERLAMSGKTWDNAKKNGVRIWICYGKHELEYDGYEQETIAVIAEGGYLLRFRPTPYMIKGKTFRPLLVDRFISLPHEFYGVGIAQILESLNYLLNHLINQILNHGDLFNSPPLIVPAEGQWSPENNIFGPGQTWQSDNSDGFQILATPDIKNSQIQMLTFVEGFIQKTLGISDFTLGSSGGSIVKNDTAHGMANILRETNRRIDFYAQNSHENFLKDMFEMMLKQNQLFLDRAEIPKITDYEAGEYDISEVTNEDIQGMYNLKIYTDSVTASKEFDQAKWLNILSTFSKIADPSTGQPLYDIKKLGNKVLNSYGEQFPENYEFKPQPANQQLGIGAQPQQENLKPKISLEPQKNEGSLGAI